MTPIEYLDAKRRQLFEEFRAIPDYEREKIDAAYAEYNSANKAYWSAVHVQEAQNRSA